MDTRKMTESLPGSEAVYEVEESETQIRFRVSSDLWFVDCIIWEAEAFVHRLGTPVRGFSIVLRGLLRNAVSHGNWNDSSQLVLCTVERTEDGFIQIRVENEDEDFEYHHMNVTTTEAIKEIRDHGYAAINTFFERLEFSPKGNRVSVCLRIVDSEIPANV